MQVHCLLSLWFRPNPMLVPILVLVIIVGLGFNCKETKVSKACRYAITPACYSSSHFITFISYPHAPFAWLPFPLHPTFILPLPAVCTDGNSISPFVHNRLSACSSTHTSTLAFKQCRPGTGLNRYWPSGLGELTGL